MSNTIMSISHISLSNQEISDTPESYGIKRSVNTKPTEEYQIGRNKVFYPLNIRSDKIIYKYDIELLLTQNKLLELDKLYKDQLYNKIYNYNINSGDYSSIFYTFDSPFTQGISNCIIDTFEVSGSVIRSGNVVYKCNLSLIEVLK